MPHLSIRVLGPLVVTLEDREITGLAYDKAWALLVYLAHAPGHSHKRESLGGLLWPDLPEGKARTNLRQALARLRKALGGFDVASSFLLVERDSIQFNAGGDATLDAAEFTVLLADCATHAHRHDETCAACAERCAISSIRRDSNA